MTLTNSGNAALTITAIGLGGTNAGDFGQTTTCPISPSTLAAGANCTLSVSFSPTASGSRTASISVTDNAGGSPQAVPLTGTGTAPAVTLGPASLSFASQPVGTTSAAQTTTLTNSGTAALAITAIAVAGANAGDFTQTTTCPLSPATLAVNATCTISVRFSPSASGRAVRKCDDRGQRTQHAAGARAQRDGILAGARRDLDAFEPDVRPAAGRHEQRGTVVDDPEHRHRPADDLGHLR